MNFSIGFRARCPDIWTQCAIVLFSLWGSLVLMMPGDTLAQEMRTWTSKDGKFTTRAVLMDVNGDPVVWQMDHGRSIKVPLESLARNDLDYVRSRKEPNVAVGILGLKGNALCTELDKRISNYHQGMEKSGGVLRVLYFHGSDSAIEADFEQRLDRVMKDIQEFYRSELARNGFASSPVLPLELDPRLLEDKGSQISYVKDGNPTTEPLARFNTTRLGGTAPGLGHALGFEFGIVGVSQALFMMLNIAHPHLVRAGPTMFRKLLLAARANDRVFPKIVFVSYKSHRAG